MRVALRPRPPECLAEVSRHRGILELVADSKTPVAGTAELLADRCVLHQHLTRQAGEPQQLAGNGTPPEDPTAVNKSALSNLLTRGVEETLGLAVHDTPPAAVANEFALSNHPTLSILL